MNKYNLIGNTYGKLTVVGEVGRNPRGLVIWRCVCSCGGEKQTTIVALNRNPNIDCGCSHITRMKTQGKHNHCRRNAESKTWRSWKSMHDRCKPNHKSKKYYYDKGITVCERWKEFINFLHDMGERPEGTTLDRINNSFGYSKENCRWVNLKTQSTNRGCVKTYTYQGDTKTLTDWAKDPRCKVPLSALYARVLKYKFEFVKSLITPKGEWK